VPDHEDLLRTIPVLYVQSNLLNGHAIYTQVARSNPRVLRVQPPLIVSAAQVDRFLDALRSTCAEWALVSDSAQAILSKSAGDIHTT
jgi:acetylornithine/succinyldiaminopimelate/putrescine aminotransferase